MEPLTHADDVIIMNHGHQVKNISLNGFQLKFYYKVRHLFNYF